MPLVALMVIRPLLSKGFAERAFHKETLRGACEAHKRVLKRAEAFSGSPWLLYMIVSASARNGHSLRAKKSATVLALLV